MILLDTNVLSEFMRPEPSPHVVSWLDTQTPHSVFTTAVSRAEIELGLLVMPRGRRQEGLVEAAHSMFQEDFLGRCLSFDEDAALVYARVVSERRRIGRPITVEDAQIAAIALSNGMQLATRNMIDFELIEGLIIVNPWNSN